MLPPLCGKIRAVRLDEGMERRTNLVSRVRRDDFRALCVHEVHASINAATGERDQKRTSRGGPLDDQSDAPPGRTLLEMLLHTLGADEPAAFSPLLACTHSVRGGYRQYMARTYR